MTESFYQRHMLVQDGPDWGVFAFANGSIQLDLGRAGLILPESLFRRFCDFVLMAQHVACRGTLTSTTEPLRIACYCPRTHITTLSFEQTTFRFRPHEFARLAQVCKQTINVLGPARTTDAPPPDMSCN